MNLAPIVLVHIALYIFLGYSAGIDGGNQDKLPRPTQKGKNTFGCLVNGKIWIPKGYDGMPSLDLYFNSKTGVFNLGAYRYSDSAEKEKQEIILLAKDLRERSTYKLIDLFHGAAIFGDGEMKCFYVVGPSVYRTGSMTITKISTKKRIISGVFEFTLAKPNCDTIKVTEGRFDMKF